MELGAQFLSGTAKNPQGRLFAPVGNYRGDPWKLHPQNWMKQSDTPAHDDIVAWHGSNTTEVPRYDSPHQRQMDSTYNDEWNDGDPDWEPEEFNVDSKERPMAEYGSAVGMHMGSVRAASVRGEKTGRVYLHPLRIPKDTVVDAPAGNFFAQRNPNEVVSGTLKTNTRVYNKDTGEEMPDNRWSDNAANYAEHATDLVEKGKTIPYRNDYEGVGSTSYRTLPDTARTWSEDVQGSVSPKYDRNADTLGRPGEPGAFRGVPHPALQHLAKLGYNPMMSRHQRDPGDIDPDKEGEHEKAYNAGRLWKMQKPNVLHDAQFRDEE